MVNIWLAKIQDRFLPSVCLLCGAPAGSVINLCDSCTGELPWLQTCCPRCALPLPISAPCGKCLQKPPPFLRTYAALHYTPPVTYLIQRMKFKGSLAAAHTLGLLLAKYLAESLDEQPQLLLPVPLHGSRLRERGYNQALEISRPIVRRLALPCRADFLRRVRATAPQSTLDGRQERQRNVQGAFELCRSLAGFRHIALLDDVLTSGATISELARLIQRAGVPRIDVWSCARAS